MLSLNAMPPKEVAPPDTKAAAIYGLVENIDENVGRLLSKLVELEIIDRTVVFFLSDNGAEGLEGGRYNAGMRGMEGTVHEGGMRVPLMKRMEVVINSPDAMKLLPKSKLGQALSYMRNHWNPLTRFLSDGRLPIDNNEVERELRRVALGRKNWMFVGSEEGGERTAIILTVVASAHRHDLDAWAYLRDVLERLARGDNALHALLPEVWKAANPEHVRHFRAEERQQRADERRYRWANERIAAKADAGRQLFQLISHASLWPPHLSGPTSHRNPRRRGPRRHGLRPGLRFAGEPPREDLRRGPRDLSSRAAASHRAKNTACLQETPSRVQTLLVHGYTPIYR